MNIIIKKLRLHSVKKVLSYILKSWKNSEFVLEQSPASRRIPVYIDLIKSYLQLGADFNDYCTFTFWNKTKEERDTFITVRRNDKLAAAYSTTRVYQLFLDKEAFNRRFTRWVKRGYISSNTSTWTEIVDFIEKYEVVIAKPLKDYGGHGVMKIDKKSPDFSIKLARLHDIVLERRGGYIIEEVIENKDSIKSIAPASLNTIRFVTIIDNKGELHIIASLLRMGNGKANTDNYHDGGMACEIDLEKKQLKGIAKGMNCARYEKHPFSGIRFDGHPVPEVQRCLDIVKEVVFTEPEARYVGWDFAITPNGVELLEGNIPPGEDITQLNATKGYWYQMLNWK